MAFHYIRKFGSEGTLQRAEGLHVGLPLQRLLTLHRLPLRISLEILTFVADALSDALKHGFVHGDVTMDQICITEDASVVVNGYGRPRRNTFAPEGIPVIESDVYGLGVLFLELLSQTENIQLPLEENLHNRRVIEIFTQIDWQEWSEQPWLPNMQEFLISMLFFDKNDRPHPLDIANILTNAIPSTTGPSLKDFLRHNNVEFPKEENLARATSIPGSALAPVEVVSDSSQGMVTGFWTKDKIAEMFLDNTLEDEVINKDWTPPTLPPSRSPSPPQEEDDHTLPRIADPGFPIDKGIQSLRSPPSLDTLNKSQPQPPSLRSDYPSSFGDEFRNSTYPASSEPSSVRSQPEPYQTPPPTLQERSTQPPPPPSINAQPLPPRTAPRISAGAPPNTYAPPAEAMRPPQQMSGTNPLKYVLFGAGGLLFLFALIGVGIAFLSSDDGPKEATSIAQTDNSEPVPEPSAENAQNIPTQVKEAIAPAPSVSPPKKKNKKKVQKKKPTTTTTSPPKPKPKPEKTTAAKSSSSTTVSPKVSGPFQVQVKFRGQEAKLFCGDGQTKEFVDAIMLSFSSKQACRIETEAGLRGLVRAEQEGSIICKINGQKILCQ